MTQTENGHLVLPVGYAYRLSATEVAQCVADEPIRVQPQPVWRLCHIDAGTLVKLAAHVPRTQRHDPYPEAGHRLSDRLAEVRDPRLGGRVRGTRHDRREPGHRRHIEHATPAPRHH